MFGLVFFQRHQRTLLWLLNAPLLGRWFRWVLRINGERSSVGRRRITGILPHAICWDHEGGEQRVAEYRTHEKFGKRLYYALAPLWWAMHAWDWALADRWVPRLSFGFSTLTAYPDASPETTSVDGYVGQDEAVAGVAWGTIRGAAGNDFDDALATEVALWIKGGTTTDQWRDLYRSVFLFDTASLGAAASVSAATLSLYGDGKGDGLGVTPNVTIVSSAPASNTGLAGTDYATLGATALCDTPITYAGWAAAYNDFALNATGLAAISTTGVSKFGGRNSNYDLANVAPTWGSALESYLSTFFADQTGTANDPKLVVTYAMPLSQPPCGMTQAVHRAAYW